MTVFLKTLLPKTFSLRLFSALTPLQRLARRVDWVALAVATVAFAADLRTLAPSVLWSDEGEFQYCAYILCVPHQTGYPLYVLLSKLWTFLPVGDVAYRVNLMSACWGVVTVVLTYWCVKWLCGRRLPAVTSALSLAFSSAFWMQSSIAGVRTLHTAFVALITLLIIAVAQRRASVEALALAVGLGLTHHRMTIFLLPGLAWALWQARSQVAWNMRRWIQIVALVALPQALYLFTWLRGSWRSSREFWTFVLALNETPTVMAKAAWEFSRQFMQQVFPSVWNAFTPIGPLIVLIGLGVLIANRRNAIQRVVGGYLATSWVLNVLFAGVHFTEDPNKYLTHGIVLQAVALGVGLAAASSWLESESRNPSSLRKRVSALTSLGIFKRVEYGQHVALIVLALPIALAATNLHAADQSGLGWIGPFTLDELASVESNSTIVADWSFIMPYRYHQVVKGHRRDLTIILPSDQAGMGRAEAKIKQGGAVYVRERYLGRRWRGQLPFVPVDRLWRVLPTPPSFDAPQSVHESFGDVVALTRVATWPADLTADRLVLLRLGWELAQRTEHDVSVSVRLVGGDGVTWQHQESPLVDSTGVLSTTAWVLGPALPPGDYHWQISVDDSSTSTNLGLADLAPFRIGPPEHPVPLSSIVVDERPTEQPGVGGWNLVGYVSAGREAQPGAFVMLPLFWQATGDAISPTPARLQLRDRQGNVVVEQNVDLRPQARAGDIIESRPTLALPVRLVDGRYDFYVVGNSAVQLASLQVKGRERLYRVPSIAHRRQVQLGGSVELLGYEINNPVEPGDKIVLKLVWRTKEVMSRGYKVFVHVVDANGKLLVQKDGVPGNWSLPTDTWAAGEIIVDPYVIPVPPEASPGDYAVKAGMYIPENGERLTAVEKGSRLADDSITLATVTIR